MWSRSRKGKCWVFIWEQFLPGLIGDQLNSGLSITTNIITISIQQQFQEGQKRPFPSFLCTVQYTHRKGEINSWSHLRTAWYKLGVQKAPWELEKAVLGLPSLEHTLGPHVLHLPVAEQDYPDFWPFTSTVTTLWWHPWEKHLRSTMPELSALTWECITSEAQS